MKKIFYFLSFLMLFVVACTKDKPEPTPKKIAGVYRLSGLKVKPDGGSQVDVYNQLNECQQNDTWDFQADGTFRYGGVQTNTCQSEDFSGTWSLNDNSFTIAGPQNTTTYQLEKFDGGTLELSTAGTVNGDPARYFVTFTKK